MDQSSFTEQWDQLSSLNQPQLFPSQQILTATADHDDLQLLHKHFNSIAKPTLTTFNCSPNMEASCKIKCSERPRKIPKTISWSCEQIPMNLVPKEEVPSAMGFLNSDSGLNWTRYQMNNNIYGQELKRNSSTGLRPGHAHDEHIIAERKRREMLSQRFIALAAVIPGLKKVDKASILGDAIKYVKELEHTVKSLEDQKVKKTVESAVLVKKSRLSTSDDNDCSVNGISPSEVCSNSDENSEASPSGKLPPEIQVRLSQKTLLLRIHCENDRGVLVKVMSEIEKLGLMVTNASVMPFVGSFLDITVTAQAGEGFSMTATELAKEISSIFQQFN